MSDHLFDVAGKVAIVTGGLGQLGRQFCVTLVERGAKVAVFRPARGSASCQSPLWRSSGQYDFH